MWTQGAHTCKAVTPHTGKPRTCQRQHSVLQPGYECQVSPFALHPRVPDMTSPGSALCPAVGSTSPWSSQQTPKFSMSENSPVLGRLVSAGGADVGKPRSSGTHLKTHTDTKQNYFRGMAWPPSGDTWQDSVGEEKQEVIPPSETPSYQSNAQHLPQSIKALLLAKQPRHCCSRPPLPCARLPGWPCGPGQVRSASPQGLLKGRVDSASHPAMAGRFPGTASQLSTPVPQLGLRACPDCAPTGAALLLVAKSTWHRPTDTC